MTVDYGLKNLTMVTAHSGVGVGQCHLLTWGGHSNGGGVIGCGANCKSRLVWGYEISYFIDFP